MSHAGTIDRAVRQRWTDRGIEAVFKAFWDEPTTDLYSAWNEGEARPKSAGAGYMPYAVYESMAGPPPTRSTGKENEPTTEIEYRTILIQFTVIAATKTINGVKSSGKQIAEPCVRAILLAFGDAAGAMPMEGDDCHIQTLVGEDVIRRTDDDVWQWTVPFEIQVERRRAIRVS